MVAKIALKAAKKCFALKRAGRPPKNGHDTPQKKPPPPDHAPIYIHHQNQGERQEQPEGRKGRPRGGKKW